MSKLEDRWRVPCGPPSWVPPAGARGAAALSWGRSWIAAAVVAWSLALTPRVAQASEVGLPGLDTAVAGIGAGLVIGTVLTAGVGTGIAIVDTAQWQPADRSWAAVDVLAGGAIYLSTRRGALGAGQGETRVVNAWGGALAAYGVINLLITPPRAAPDPCARRRVSLHLVPRRRGAMVGLHGAF